MPETAALASVAPATSLGRGTNRSKDTRRGHPYAESQTKNTGTNLTTAPDGTQHSHSSLASSHLAAEPIIRREQLTRSPSKPLRLTGAQAKLDGYHAVLYVPLIAGTLSLLLTLASIGNGRRRAATRLTRAEGMKGGEDMHSESSRNERIISRVRAIPKGFVRGRAGTSAPSTVRCRGRR